MKAVGWCRSGTARPPTCRKAYRWPFLSFLGLYTSRHWQLKIHNRLELSLYGFGFLFRFFTMPSQKYIEKSKFFQAVHCLQIVVHVSYFWWLACSTLDMRHCDMKIRNAIFCCSIRWGLQRGGASKQQWALAVPYAKGQREAELGFSVTKTYVLGMYLLCSGKISSVSSLNHSLKTKIWL